MKLTLHILLLASVTSLFTLSAMDPQAVFDTPMYTAQLLPATDETVQQLASMVQLREEHLKVKLALLQELDLPIPNTDQNVSEPKKRFTHADLQEYWKAIQAADASIADWTYMLVKLKRSRLKQHFDAYKNFLEKLNKSAPTEHNKNLPEPVSPQNHDHLTPFPEADEIV